MKENEYYTENVIDPDFFISILKQKSNLQLVETDLFENLYNNYKDFFINNKSNDKYIKNIKSFYDLIDDPSFDLSRLNRYYIFVKN